MPKETDTLSSVVTTVSGKNSQDLETLGKNLNLMVPSSVKECRQKRDKELTRKARCDMIGNSLILLQACIGRENPSQSEFELCAQKIIGLVPEMKDPLPPIHRESFKEWVSGNLHSCEYSMINPVHDFFSVFARYFKPDCVQQLWHLNYLQLSHQYKLSAIYHIERYQILFFQGTVLQNLKKAYYNRKPVEKPRKQAAEERETASTAEGHDKKLKEEMRVKKTNLKKINALLTASLAHRRKWIENLTGKGAAKKIIDEYPGFKNYNQVSKKLM